MQILGLFLISLPFIGLFIYLTKTDGLKFALEIFLGSALIVACISLGAFLAFGG